MKKLKSLTAPDASVLLPVRAAAPEPPRRPNPPKVPPRGAGVGWIA